MKDVYFISNDGNVILIIDKNEFNNYFVVFNETNVKSRPGFYMGDDYYDGCEILNHGTFIKSYNVLGFYFLNDRITTDE
jgi:hypothetical protein